MVSFYVLRCDCYLRTTDWRGSDINFPCEYDGLEKGGSVIFYRVLTEMLFLTEF